MWSIRSDLNNARKWLMGFNWAFKRVNAHYVIDIDIGHGFGMYFPDAPRP
jgi:hypothetical protein